MYGFEYQEVMESSLPFECTVYPGIVACRRGCILASLVMVNIL
jgi:hypothetical protein